VPLKEKFCQAELKLPSILRNREMKNTKLTICLFLVVLTGSANAQVLTVPTDYSTIQAAIDAGVDGDTVIVTPGTYSGSGNRNINLLGKAITVQSTDPANPGIVSTTVIDCQGSPSTRGFIFNSQETIDSKVMGLTIKNGNNFKGGGIYCYNESSPTISNCVVTANSAVFGGGLAVEGANSFPLITNCQIIGNSALAGGGGVYCNGSNPTIVSSLVCGNFAPRGGAFYGHNVCTPVINNSTISGNAATVSAGGLCCYGGCDLSMENCIVWDNSAFSASDLFVAGLGAPTTVDISYCDIYNSAESVVCDSTSTINWGQGNIDADPNFIDDGILGPRNERVGADYHLNEGSPCIDAGDPCFVAEADSTDIDGQERLSGAAVDIGADEVVIINTILADVRIMPKTLNLNSRGRWMLAAIRLEGDYDIKAIDVDSITLNSQIRPVLVRAFGRWNKLFAVFKRSEVQEMLSDSEGSVLLTVGGNLEDGTPFEGRDTIKVVARKKKVGRLCNKFGKCKKLRVRKK